MDGNGNQTEARQPSRLDGILASDDELVPSSGFLAAVMERVREEDRMPAPIAFPWKRAVPGLVLACGVFGWAGEELVRVGVPAMRGISLSPPQVPVSIALPLQQAGWVALALGVSLGSWLLARRIANG